MDIKTHTHTHTHTETDTHTFPASEFNFSKKIEIFCAELNLRKQKWLIFCCYNPHKHLTEDHWLQIEKYN